MEKEFYRALFCRSLQMIRSLSLKHDEYHSPDGAPPRWIGLLIFFLKKNSLPAVPEEALMRDSIIRNTIFYSSGMKK